MSSFKRSVKGCKIGEPYGVCDLTGMIVPRKDLVPQMQLSRTGLYDTGMLVYYKYADIPDTHDLSPGDSKGDPTPVENPRPDYQLLDANISPKDYDVSASVDIELSVEDIQNYWINFTGNLIADITITVPNVPFTITMRDATNSDFFISVQLKDYLNQQIVLDKNWSMQIASPFVNSYMDTLTILEY